MKKIKNLFMLLVAVFAFMPAIKVNAKEYTKDLVIGCAKTSVELGENLAAFEITDNTEHASVAAYGEGTEWAYKQGAEDDWATFTGSPVANSKDTHYGLKIRFIADEDYYIIEEPYITFNDSEYYTGYTTFVQTDEGGFLYIDLGTPNDTSSDPGDDPVDPPVDPGDDPVEPDPEVVIYTISFDLNGAKIDEDYDEPENEVVDAGFVINFSNPAYYIFAPKLHIFAGYQIDGEVYQPGESYTVNKNITVKFLWEEQESEDYVVELEEQGITVEFTEIAGKEFNLSFMSISMLTDEYIEENFDPEDVDFVKEEIAKMKEVIIEGTKDLGEFIDFYMFELADEDYNSVHEGPFTIKIKLTEEMKKYNKFYMVFLKENEDDEYDVTDEMYEFTIEGDYLVGTVDHFSEYALIGSYEEEPATGDNVVLFIILALTSAAGLFSVRTLKRN